MNRAELAHYEATGQGWAWTVAELTRTLIPFSEWNGEPSFRVKRSMPTLRAEYSKRLWATICDAKAPLQKAEWLNQARVFGRTQRILGASTIVNLLKGNWVREDDGFYRRNTQR